MTAPEGSVAVDPDGRSPDTPAEQKSEAVHDPAKVIRIVAMVSQLLAEVRDSPLDEAGRRRLGQIHDASIRELEATVSSDLARELSLMALPLDGTAPSSAEIRMAQAQLVGWLQGVVHGIQAAILSQQADTPIRLPRARHDRAAADGPPVPERPPFSSGGAYL